MQILVNDSHPVSGSGSLLCFLVEMNKNEYLNCFMEHGVNGVCKSEFAESLLKAMLCCAVMFLLYTSPHVERWKL